MFAQFLFTTLGSVCKERLNCSMFIFYSIASILIILELFAKHMNRTHPEVVEKEWFKCSQCPLKFPTVHGRKVHIIR